MEIAIVLKKILLGLTIVSGVNFIAAASAQAITITSVDTGWYDSTGGHGTENTNYFAGSDSTTSDPPVVGLRNFGVFDLTGISEPISRGRLRAFLPFDGFLSPDTTETWELHEVTTNVEVLTAGTGGLSAYSDLADGPSYGSQAVTNSDEGTFIEVTLNSDALLSLNSASGLWAVGGICVACDTADEYIFGFSGSDQWVLQVPEPTTILGSFLLLGIYGVLKRKSLFTAK
jgi:large repetitive protein